MSSLVVRSLFPKRLGQRGAHRSRSERRFRLGVELLDDRITPTTSVTGLSPAVGPAIGGTLVTITGTGFTSVTAVNFGTSPATSDTVVSPTTITAESPAGAGTVDVTVTASGGTSPITPADEFTYGPTVTGLSPTTGPATGGTTVTIIGTGFTGATAVDFGTAPASGVTVVNANSITVVTPAGSGAVNVTVTTPAGTSPVSVGDVFNYPDAPVVSGLSPASGPAAGGTTVTISGTGFTGATAVDFGTVAATDVTVVSDTSVTAVSPAGTGVVDVTVIAPGGTSAVTLADQFTYGPAVTSVSPRTGPATGGTTVIITGTGLANATSVDFGSTPATDIISDSATQIEVVNPAGAGVVDVIVTTPISSSATSQADYFFYVTPGNPVPTVSSISPAGGPPSGATLVTITGTGFDPFSLAAVYFGTTASPGVDVLSSTTILAESPSGSGTVNVTVVTTGGVSATSPADQFSYGPTVTSVSPTSGPVGGGTFVTITGVNLGNVTGINFGSVAATTLVSESATQLVVVSPAGAVAGAVDVTVTTPGGTSATSAADEFFYIAPGAVQPRIFSISPQVGPPGGGTVVTIQGTGFDETTNTAVYFGLVPSTSVTVVSPFTIEAISPAGSVGTVDVTVNTYGGTSLAVTADQFSYVINGPQVTAVDRYGYHAQPTYLVIEFDSALDSTTAQNVANYHLVGPSGQRIKIKSAIFNTATDAVTLVLAQRLNLPKTYRLTIDGTSASGVSSSDGVLLDGASNGYPGSNFVTSITRSNLAGSASQRPAATALRARARTLARHLTSVLHRHH